MSNTGAFELGAILLIAAIIGQMSSHVKGEPLKIQRKRFGYDPSEEFHGIVTDDVTSSTSQVPEITTLPEGPNPTTVTERTTAEDITTRFNENENTWSLMTALRVLQWVSGLQKGVTVKFVVDRSHNSTVGTNMRLHVNWDEVVRRSPKFGLSNWPTCSPKKATCTGAFLNEVLTRHMNYSLPEGNGFVVSADITGVKRRQVEKYNWLNSLTKVFLLPFLPLTNLWSLT